MRRPLVAGNWKMNGTTAQAGALAEGLLNQIMWRDDVDVVVCPPYLSIAKVRELNTKHKLSLGAQDVFWVASGAFTGRVSAPMLSDLGVEYCIVGHSETRGRFGKLDVAESTVGFFVETDETVGLKIAALLEHGIKPIFCVGETLTERESGKTDAIIQSQITNALANFDESELATLVIAYEPVWAIGTGQVCDSPEAERICGMIRDHIRSQFSSGLADGMRVLYGGSVSDKNAHELFMLPNIDGGLVGGASLKADSFAAIIAAVPVQ